jgi:disulfide bond formation protein DsbB
MRALLLALLLSAAAAVGSLYLSLGLHLNACPLCFYQRTFAFALVAVLVVGLVTLGEHRPRLVVLCLPLAIGGLGVAGFHTYLVFTKKLECPLGIADLGPAPAQSLAVFALIVLALLYGFIENVRENGIVPLFLALGLGAAAVYGSVAPGVNPPPAKADKPTEPGERIQMCRVPYTPPEPAEGEPGTETKTEGK